MKLFSYIVCFCAQNAFLSFDKLKIEPLSLLMSIITFWGQQISIPQEAYGLQWRSNPAFRFHQKYLNSCSEDERRSYRVGTTWGGV